ncbi:transporter [Pontiellaceae bacterium B1224]|nr:transporter [Pontiellaceae bacterium B1224]
MNWLKVCAVVFVCSLSAWSAEQCASCGTDCGCGEICECNHEPRAPIGVMGDHVHHQGGWMVSYRYMFMSMEGLRDGTSSVSLDQVLMPTGTYMMAPVSMDMQMHMFGAMYTPINNLTVGLMLPYKVNKMEMQAMSGVRSEMDSSGFGDLKLSGNYRLWSSSAQQLLFNLALSFPTGSIDEENAAGQHLPYPMQLGSGSYGLIPGITYSGLSNGWGWGAQANGTFYLNENDNDYTLGNRYGLQAWGLRDLCKSSALSLRLSGNRVENIHGADPTLNPMMTPVADPNLRAGTQVDLLAGIDYRKNFMRLALEAGLPVYQELDGPQLETDWKVIAGLQLSF